MATKRTRNGANNEPLGASANVPVEPATDILGAQNQLAGMVAELPKKITEETLVKAYEILAKYKSGKANLEKKIVQEEQFWKLKEADARKKKDEDYKPSTAWLWSCIESRYSDAMDSYPTCNFLARQEDDKQEAETLSNIIPVILEQNRYEETYSDNVRYTLKHGGGAQGVFWDRSKYNGLGDIEIKKVDLLNLFWEGGVTDIQDSPNLFCVELVDKTLLEQRYPETKGRLQSTKFDITKYIYDDSVDVKDKAVVIDWYYHTEYNGRKALQYVKFVENIVLYATENDTTIPTKPVTDPVTGETMLVAQGEPPSVRGLYDHCMYPFVVQPLYPIEGSVCGYGLIDIGRDAQKQIDTLNKAITDNAVFASAPQYFVSEGCGINEEEFLDTTKPLKKIAGNLQDKVLPIETTPMSSIYVDILSNKVEELKYVTSNQDVGNGVAPSGITAASAIAALQETQGKNARSTNKTFYRAYRDVVYLVIELIRQFYDLPRTFRIAPDSLTGQEHYTVFTNEGLKPKPQIIAGQDFGLRKPEFDIEVSAEKASPYKKIEQNELALQFYQQGFFNPQMADQALACLEMMDFPHKEEIMQRVMQNGTIMQLLLQYQQIALQLAQRVGDPMLVEQLSQAVLQSGGQAMPQAADLEHLDGQTEHPFVEKARANARESTQVE